MKNIILFFTLLSVFCLGCKKTFLESEPLTLKTDANYYKTPQDAFETLVGCYNYLSGGYGDFFLIAEIASDDCFGGGGYNDALGNQSWDEFTNYNDLEINRYTWNNRFFRAVRRTNVLLENLDNIDWKNDTNLRTRYEAEARFLRAHYFFELQRNFGHIPLVKTSNSEIIPQTDPDVVYAYIIEDLKFAIENLEPIRFQDDPESEYGRITKWAAEGYLARVFLFYTGYYAKEQAPGLTKQETIAYINDCIQNSGHSLVQRYASLWPWSMRLDYHKDPTLNYAGEYNSEIMWAVKHSTISPAQRHSYIGMRGVPSKGAYDPFWDGWGMCTVTAKRFNSYAPGDTRRFASIIDLVAEGIPNDGTDQREWTGYVQKKYITRTDPSKHAKSYPESIGGTNWQAEPQDDIMLRYADVLLMAAELELETNPSNSQLYLDMVRDRAFEDQAHRVPATKESIFDERGYELFFEGIRYYDVLRQGLTRAKEILDVHNVTVWNGKHETLKNIDFPIVKAGLLLIPQSQILLSEGMLVQNPGW